LVPAAVACLVIASLSAGLYIANRERAIAQKRFMEVRQLATSYSISTPWLATCRVVRRPANSSSIHRSNIWKAGGRCAKRSGLALEVGNAYMRVARVQGVPIGPNLGQLDKATANLKIADGMMQEF